MSEDNHVDAPAKGKKSTLIELLDRARTYRASGRMIAFCFFLQSFIGASAITMFFRPRYYRVREELLL